MQRWVMFSLSVKEAVEVYNDFDRFRSLPNYLQRWVLEIVEVNYFVVKGDELCYNEDKEN